MSHGKATCYVRLTDDQKMECKIIAAKRKTYLRVILEDSLRCFLEHRDEGEMKYLPSNTEAKIIQLNCDKILSEQIRGIAEKDNVRFINVFTTALLNYLDTKEDKEQGETK